jgi:hypothetical protein
MVGLNSINQFMAVSREYRKQNKGSYLAPHLTFASLYLAASESNAQKDRESWIEIATQCMNLLEAGEHFQGSTAAQACHLFIRQGLEVLKDGNLTAEQRTQVEAMKTRALGMWNDLQAQRRR